MKKTTKKPTKKATKKIVKKKVVKLKRKRVSYRPRCSGWKVFPDGIKCKGCPDCGQKVNKNKIESHIVYVKS